jgi:hypothetical protein
LFGGDGATFIIPQILLKKVIAILENYSLHIRRNVTLIHRVGYILIQMDALFDTFKNRHPIKPKKLKLNFSLLKIWEEMKISVSEKNTGYLLKNWIKTLI